MKLSATFLLSVISIAALGPLTFGVSGESLLWSVCALVVAALCTERGASAKRGAFGQLGEVGALEKEYKEVQTNLKKVGDDLKAYAEQSKAELAKHSTMSEETKNSVDKLLMTQGELQARLQAAEQLIVSLDSGGAPAAPKSLGRSFIEHEEFKANAERLGRTKGSFSIPVSAAITSDSGSAGDLVDPQRRAGIVGVPERRLFIRDLLNWGPTTSNSIEYVKETGFTNNADVVSENPSGGKPESSLVFDLASAPVATIAHFIHATKQILSDAGMLAAHIDGRLRYGLKLKEELQLLKGSGVGLNINGLYTQASAYADPGVYVDTLTNIDQLRIALLQCELAEYTADGIVLNPIDWTTIELTKDANKGYIFANPTMMGMPSLWGRPIVSTQSMDSGEFLTGAFKMGAMGWDREDVSVQISTEDRDNFIKNMVTILCEERVALTVERPEAFVKGDFAVYSS